MRSDFDNARYAVGVGLKSALPHAMQEYHTFLEHLKKMQPHLTEWGVSFELDDGAPAPEVLKFQTPLGEILMQRVFVLDGKFVAVAVVLYDLVGDGLQQVRRDLWSLRLNWNSQWTYSTGEVVEHEFGTGAPSPRTAFEAVHAALATKLLLDNERWAVRPTQPTS